MATIFPFPPSLSGARDFGIRFSPRSLATLSPSDSGPGMPSEFSLILIRWLLGMMSPLQSRLPPTACIPRLAHMHVPCTADTIYGAIEAIAHSPTSPHHDFNLRFLFCVVKRMPAPPLGAWFLSMGKVTLDLSRVSTLIIESWQARFGYMSSQLRNLAPLPIKMVFGKGCTGNANILDLEMHSRRLRYTSPQASVGFLGFIKVAFPSIPPQRVHIAGFAMYPLPAPRSSLLRGTTMAMCAEYTYGSIIVSCLFLVACSVRQGCLSSPLLLATVLDVLLGRLVCRWVGIVSRAFVDDVGSILRSLTYLHCIFVDISQFAHGSGCFFNLQKILPFPPWHAHLNHLHAMLADMHPLLSKIEAAYAAKYLGLLMGLDGAASAWEKAACKLSSYAFHLGQGASGPL